MLEQISESLFTDKTNFFLVGNTNKQPAKNNDKLISFLSFKKYLKKLYKSKLFSIINNNMFSEQQCGFLPKHSIEHTALTARCW